MTVTHKPVVNEARAAPPRRRRWWLWVVSAILVVVLALAGGIWWFLDSTVPVGDYDEAVAELLATEEALAGVEEDLAAGEAEVAELHSEIESLATENARAAQDLTDEQRRTAALVADHAAMRIAVVSALAAAHAQATDVLNFDPDFAVEIQEAGADLSLADDLLADLGRDESFVEWAAGNPWSYADRSMMDVDDEVLFGAYSTWSYAELDSPEESASFWEYQWRLSHLILEPLLEVELLLEDLAATTPSA